MKPLIAAILTLTFSSASFAGNGGSVYSLFGIGDLRYFPGARSAGMGYTGIGLPGTNYINGTSPATWARINRTRLDAAFLYEGFNSSDGTQSIFLSRSEFNGALLAIPLSPAHGIVIVAGFSPYSNVNYDTFTKDSQQGIDYTINRVGTGGVSKAQIGFSYSPLQDLSFGASLDYLFGSIDDERIFTPTSSAYVGGTTTQTTSIRGATVTLGGLYSGMGSISGALRPLSIGFVITSRGNLRTESQRTFQSASDRDSADQVNERITIPIAFGVGVAYQVGERYLFAADYYAQAWGNAQFNGVYPTEIRNSYRIGIGGERLPSREFSAGWLDRLAYRLGIFQNATYYKINGQAINEWGVTGGLAIPISGETRLNVALDYGGRGTTSNGLVKDRIFRVSVSLNISDLWFVRYEEE